jgi:uncharacterized protein YdhG (YjbR/CyaY superfamily)
MRRSGLPPLRSFGRHHVNEKTNSDNRVSAARAKLSEKSVDQYLARVPEPARGTLNKVRATIRSAAPPEATEAISYGIPTFQYKGPLFGYAAFPRHCSLFPMSSSIVEAFKDELKNFQTSKGTIRFPVNKPPSATIIKKLVKARIAENERKKQG